MNPIALSSLLIVSSILLGNLFIYGLIRRKIPGMIPFAILIAAMLIHSLGYAFELLGGTLDTMYSWVRVEYIGIAFYPFLFLLFTREYTDEKKYANKIILILLLTENIMTFMLVQTNSIHWLYYSTIGVNLTPGFRVLLLEKGIWFYIHAAGLLFSTIYSAIIFFIKLKNSREEYRKKVAVGLAGASIPMISLFVYLFGGGPAGIDFLPFSYLFMILIIFIGLLRYDILVLTPVTYEMIFNSIEEGVFVIDKNSKILSFNHILKNYFPSLAQVKPGEHFASIIELQGYDFRNFPEKFEVKDRIFHIKMSHMSANKVWIFVISDITESEKTKKQLELLATRDTLTGLYNRRYFMQKLEEETRQGTLIMIDIDHFKKVNDEYGHFEGDKVITFFGKEIIKHFENQLYCRFGGEEFLIFMPDTNINDAYNQVESMRNHMRHSSPITFSAGLAKHKNESVMEAIDIADKKMYEAKQNGRNQTKYEGEDRC